MEAGGALQTIVTRGEVCPSHVPNPGLVLPRRFGNYELQERLGRGGMGVVWKAKLTGTGRVVALKQVVAPEFATATAIERFKVEARAAAALDHQGIVPVYDIGEVERCPYYTMPVVTGGNLKDRLARGPIAPLPAARMLVELAEAVQHAHDRGVIHRDLKPENILLQGDGTRSGDDNAGDGMPNATDERAAALTPRLTDFGLARSATGGVAGVTRTGCPMGTPSYMAPEQATADGARVGPLSDVYGLGAVLYCCLTGRPPFHAAGVLETLIQVREREPVPVRQLNAAVPRDLETICLKCLEKEPHRRYRSAGELASDLRRYERGEPIRAVPAGTLTRLGKWVRRSPAVAGLLAAVITSLLLGTSAFAWQARSARRERDAAVAARAAEKRTADELRRVSDFQAKMLGQVDPTAAGLLLAASVREKYAETLARAGVSEPRRAKEVEAFVREWARLNATDTARELIERTILGPAVTAVDRQFADQPLVAATLLQALASRYAELGLYDTALSIQERVLATRRRLLTDDHADTVCSVEVLGQIQQYRGKLPEAEECHRAVFEWRRRVLGDDNGDTLCAMSNLGEVLKSRGQLPEAEEYCRRALERRRRVSGDEDPLTLACLDRMGTLLYEEGELAEAEACHNEALTQRRRVLGLEHADTLQSQDNLAVLLNEEGKRVEAQVLLRDVLEKRRRILGEAHPLTMASLHNLATTLSLSGRRTEAEALYREALASQLAALGAEHPRTLLTRNNLAVALIEQGKLAEAEPMCRELLELRRRVSGAKHPDTLLAVNSLASLLRRENKLVEAEVYMRQTLELARETLGDDHPETLVYRHNLGVTLREQKKPREAEPHLRAVVEAARKKLGKEHLTTLVATTSLGSALADQERFVEVVGLLAPLEGAVRKSCTGSNSRTLAVLLMNLGKSRTALHEFSAAEAQLLEARTLFVESRGPAHRETVECTRRIVDLYTNWNASAPDRSHAEMATEWSQKLRESARSTGQAQVAKP